MKKNLILAFIMLTISPLTFAQKPIYTKAKVTAAKVYTYYAGLENSVNFEIPQGPSEIVIGNIADEIINESIQFQFANKNISVLSSQFSTNYVEDFKVDNSNPSLKKVTDSIKIVEKNLLHTQIELDANQKTIELLDKNQMVLVGSQASSVSQLTQLTDYYTQKRISVSNTIEDIKLKISTLQEKLNRLKSSLKTQSENEIVQFSKGVIVLKLNAEKAEKVNLKLSYLSFNASWVPKYEIISNSINEPLKVIFKALVNQNTGLDWKGVKLTLIDGRPTMNKNAPELSPWFIHARKNVPEKDVQYMEMQQVKVYKKAVSAQPVNDVMMTSNANFQINENSLNQSYDVDIPYDILSNKKDHLIALFEQKIEASYEYFTAPNYNKEAFLVAKIKDFSKYNLIAARANIIFENMYVGETQISPNRTEDELQITMGNDPRISIKRENIKDKSGEKFLSSYTEKTTTYDLVIRNNKKESIKITIKDRVPVSNSEDVKVEILDISGAQLDAEKGFLTWEEKINPNETKKIRISYKVRYPKDAVID